MARKQQGEQMIEILKLSVARSHNWHQRSPEIAIVEDKVTSILNHKVKKPIEQTLELPMLDTKKYSLHILPSMRIRQSD
jgi:hypothetical protein